MSKSVAGKRKFTFESKGWKRRFANFLSRRLKRYKPLEETTLNPLALLKDLRTAIVVLPLDEAFFAPIQGIIIQFQEKFPHLKLTLACPYNYEIPKELSGIDKMIIIDAQHANFVKLPKKSLIAEFRAGTYDAAIDLNPAGTLFSNILCSVSGAEVRIGFSGEWSEHFLNFSFAPRIRGSLADNYKALLDYLS